MKIFIFLRLLLIACILISETSQAKQLVEPRPLPESRIKVPSEWRTCSKDMDCSWINYGCGGLLTVNRAFQEQARNKAYKEGGDPRAISCVAPAVTENQGPMELLCRDKSCSIFTLPACRDSGCKQKFPKCKVFSKFFLDPKIRGTYSSFENYVWGPSREDCVNRCKRYTETLRSLITRPEEGHYEIECRLDEKKIHTEKVKGLAEGGGF